MNQLSQKRSALRDVGLRRFVERSAASQFETKKRVTQVERRLNDYHSSFAIEELIVYFKDGQRLPLIFKNLSPDGLLDYARHIRPHFSYDPLREITVYRKILAGAGLGTPSCYGAFTDPIRRRYWLLLEKVPGHVLAKTGEFSIWCDAARWLARMHSRLVDVVNQDHSACLLTYNEDFFDLWIDRAEHFCSLRDDFSQCLAPRGVQWLADQCRRAARYICHLPKTFIHGEYYASNIVINRQGNRTRICPIDWETAAIGPGLLDLAALVAGNWTDQERMEMVQAYSNALSPAMRVYGNDEDMMKALQCCRLFMAVKWLGWSSDWQAPDEHRCDWLTEAMQLAHTIEADQA